MYIIIGHNEKEYQEVRQRKTKREKKEPVSWRQSFSERAPFEPEFGIEISVQ